MPLYPDSPYRPPPALRNGHLQTLYPTLLRKVPLPPFARERITTPDGDFLDLDWLRQPQPANGAGQHPRPLAILTHGLEGNSTQNYMLGMARALHDAGWDVLSWNMRGCSGEPNRCLRSYHSGATDDLDTVVRHAGISAAARHCSDSDHDGSSDHRGRHHDNNRHAGSGNTRGNKQHSNKSASNALRIALIGFSLGGNIVLKYVGDSGAAPVAAPARNRGLPLADASATTAAATGTTNAAAEAETGAQAVTQASAAKMPETLGMTKTSETSEMTRAATAKAVAGVTITHAVGISVPCDLQGSTAVLERASRRIYMARFLKTLRAKIRTKKRQFPDAIDDSGLDSIRTFRAFDDRYTAPLHGFKDAVDYWQQCSCLHSLPHIKIPTLLLNAADDPFLSPGCYPREIADAHPHLHLEIPRHGGHVGFVRTGKDALYYSETRTLAFLQQNG